MHLDSTLSKASATNPVVYLVALGAFALGMASYVTAGLLPMIAGSFDVTLAVAAQLVTAFTLAYGLGSPLVVALLPARGQAAALLAALAVFSAANAASTLAADFRWLMIFRALAGLGSGVYLALGITAATSVSPGRQGKAIALIMGGMASGTVLGVPTGLMLAQHTGWTGAFWLIALLGLIATLGLAWKLPPLPALTAVALRKKLALLADRSVATVLAVSLLAAIGSLGMYTFLAALLTDPGYGGVTSIAPWLWVWGAGGIAGSFLVGPIADRIADKRLAVILLALITLALAALPVSAHLHAWLAFIPIALWGAAGWALQVPQNNALIRLRKQQGDSHLAIALNESALYLGSALGAAGGGLILLTGWPLWTLPASAATAAALACALATGAESQKA